jgi:hypothetical protein
VLLLSVTIGIPWLQLQTNLYLTTIGGPGLGTFGRNDVPQRIINQSLYQEILLLQKFNDIGGKVLKQKNKPPTSEKK